MLIVITATIRLKHCWVCPRKKGLHHHHVVPTSYGGKDGPQVTLCGTCHTMIHSMSLKAPDRWRFDDDFNPTQRAKLLYLTKVIASARAKTKGLNRPVQLNQELGVTSAAKLRAIQKLRGFSSRQKTIDWLIDLGYATVLKRANQC